MISRLSTLLTIAFVSLAAETAYGQGSQHHYDLWSSYAKRTSGLVFRDSVTPNWVGDSESHFWYSVRTGKQTHRYVLVDTAAGERDDAFNHDKLSAALADITGRPVSPERLDLKSLSFSDSLSLARFGFGGASFEYQRPAGPLRKVDSATLAAGNAGALRARQTIVRSGPSGLPTTVRFENKIDKPLDVMWVMTDGNLRPYGEVKAGKTFTCSTYAGHSWLLQSKQSDPVACFVSVAGAMVGVVDAATPRPTETQRTRSRSRRSTQSPDGRFRVKFADSNIVLSDGNGDSETKVTSDGRSEDAYGGQVWWAPDSMSFVVMKTAVGQHRTINMIESSPNGSIHAQLHTLRYDKPGDRIDHPRPVLVDAETGRSRVIDDSFFDNPFKLTKLKWSDDGRSFSFLYNERGHQVLRLISVDAESAVPRVVIDEVSDSFVCYSQKNYLQRIDETNEVVWMSERSGHNHLYLIDSETGKIKNSITSGNWVVRRVESLDIEKRQIWLSVGGYNPGEDPYHEHLLRVDLDGGNQVPLTAGDGQHRWSWSPERRFLIDRYSRVDQPAVINLRDGKTGELVCELEAADITLLLETGWQMPQRFVAKARDGETNIHGVIIRPTNFDPQKKYPVLESIYAGPHSAFVPKTFGTHTSMGKMAELGFIVVKIDGMGTSHRSKAFHDVCWKNLGDSGFPDRTKWITAAAAKHAELDTTRVGIWGGSAGGQSAMRALITHGDFYHAAAADCGCHDNRVDKIWWNEQWMGWPIGEHYEQQSNVTQAHRVSGDLMLIVGELDRNVDPATTMQVVNALIKADKDFELLVIPGAGHGAAGSAYGARRQADFFVRKLWGNEPRKQVR